MKRIRKIAAIILLFSSSSIFGQEGKYDGIISRFISYVKENDSQSISKLIDYPFCRKYPIPSIKDENEFVARYNEIIDDSLKNTIVRSDVRKDWSEMGWRGIMLSNGVIWLQPDGRLSSVNYESNNEHNERLSIIEQEKARIHESIKKFNEPILVWETKKFRIRIDQLADDTYRYASWKIGKGQNEKPDLILTNGELEFHGSGGNRDFLFKRGAYEYRCRVVVLGSITSPSGYLIVRRNGKQILKEEVINDNR